MRHSLIRFAVAALFMGTVADAQTVTWPVLSYTSTQTLTQAAPTLITDGYGLLGIQAYRVTVCAATAQTLSGAGTLYAYLYSPAQGLWVHTKALDVSVTASGEQCQGFGDVHTYVQVGRVKYVANSVTVSGGTTVIVSMEMVQP